MRDIQVLRHGQGAVKTIARRTLISSCQRIGQKLTSTEQIGLLLEAARGGEDMTTTLLFGTQTDFESTTMDTAGEHAPLRRLARPWMKRQTTSHPRLTRVDAWARHMEAPLATGPLSMFRPVRSAYTWTVLEAELQIRHGPGTAACDEPSLYQNETVR